MKFLRKSLFFGEQTFRRWFVSSMCVILIFIAAGLLLYLVALYATEKTVVMAQRQAAEQTGKLIDIQLLDIRKDISALAFNERLLSVASIERPLAGVDYYNFHKAAEELRGLFLYGNVADIFVYYGACDCYISPYRLILDNNGDFTQKQFGMDREQWRQFAAEQTASSFRKQGGSIYYYSPLKRSVDRNTASLAIVKLDSDALSHVLSGESQPISDDAGYSYIVSSDGSLVAATGHVEQLPFAYGSLRQGENYMDKNVITSHRIQNAEWEYISIVPIQRYFKQIRELKFILYAYIGVCIVLAVAIVYMETRRRYRPVLALSHKVRLNRNRDPALPEEPSGMDIFVGMQETIQSIADYNAKLTTLLRKDKETMLSQGFSEMIGEHAAPASRGTFFEDHFATSYGQGFLTVVSVRSWGTKLGDLPRREREHVLLICLNNIGKELLGIRRSCFFWKHTDIAGVLWSSEDEEETDLNVLDVLEQTGAGIKRYFDVELQFSLSRRNDADSSMAAAYTQAQETADYAAMTGKTGVVGYDDSYSQPQPVWHHIDIITAEQDFKAYMLEHNYERAKDKLETIIGYYGYSDGASIQLLKCRMFGLINLMLNAIEMRKTPAEEQFFSDMNPVQRLLNASTIQSLEKEIMSIIEAMIAQYEEKEDSTEKKLVYIDRYIEAHYMDQDLSVQQLAEQYQLSVSYLSKVYKQHRGAGILETINTCRIRHAKLLLARKPDMPLTQIAEKIGYGNVQTLMRIFKKLENETPGQYRARSSAMK